VGQPLGGAFNCRRQQLQRGGSFTVRWKGGSKFLLAQDRPKSSPGGGRLRQGGGEGGQKDLHWGGIGWGGKRAGEKVEDRQGPKPVMNGIMKNPTSTFFWGRFAKRRTLSRLRGSCVGVRAGFFIEKILGWEGKRLSRGGAASGKDVVRYWGRRVQSSRRVTNKGRVKNTSTPGVKMAWGRQLKSQGGGGGGSQKKKSLLQN